MCRARPEPPPPASPHTPGSACHLPAAAPQAPAARAAALWGGRRRRRRGGRAGRGAQVRAVLPVPPGQPGPGGAQPGGGAAVAGGGAGRLGWCGGHAGAGVWGAPAAPAAIPPCHLPGAGTKHRSPAHLPLFKLSPSPFALTLLPPSCHLPATFPPPPRRSRSCSTTWQPPAAPPAARCTTRCRRCAWRGTAAACAPAWRCTARWGCVCVWCHREGVCVLGRRGCVSVCDVACAGWARVSGAAAVGVLAEGPGEAARPGQPRLAGLRWHAAPAPAPTHPPSRT